MNLGPPEPPPGKPHTAAAWTSSGCERWPRAPLVVAELKSWSWRDAPLGEGGRRGSRWREGSPAGPGVQRRWWRRARLVCACVCVCVCVSLGNRSRDRLGPDRPSAWAAALGHSGRPWGAPGRGDGGAASRPYGALPGLGPHPCQPGGQTRTPGRGGGPRAWKHVLKWSELTLNDAPGLDNPYLEYLMWLPLLLNARHLILQYLTF